MKFCIAFLKQLRRSAVLNFLFSVKYIHKNCKLAYRSDSAVFAHNTENRKLRTAMNSCRGFPNCNTETHFCWFPAISFPTPSPFLVIDILGIAHGISCHLVINSVTQIRGSLLHLFFAKRNGTYLAERATDREKPLRTGEMRKREQLEIAGMSSENLWKSCRSS